jgi:hypothetical protein
MCDWFPNNHEVAINACWLQEQLRELEECKRIIHKLRHKNEVLQALQLVKDLDYPEYRIDVKA